MLKPSGNFVLDGFTIDGDRNNQPVEDGTNKGIVDTIYYDGSGGELFLAQHNRFQFTASCAIECVNLSGEFKLIDNQFRDFGFEPFYSDEPAVPVRVPLAVYLSDGNQGIITISRNSFVKGPTDPQAGAIMLAAQEGEYHSASITDNYFERVGLSTSNAAGAVDLYDYVHRSVISGNRFQSLTYSAITVGNSADVIITNNVIY